jgi:hypothetical protein
LELSSVTVLYSILKQSLSNSEKCIMLCHCLSSSIFTNNISGVCRCSVQSFQLLLSLLKRWDSFELWNMMLYQFVEYCSCRLSLSICFLPSSTATNIFAEFAELRVLQLS